MGWRGEDCSWSFSCEIPHGKAQIQHWYHSRWKVKVFHFVYLFNPHNSGFSKNEWCVMFLLAQKSIFVSIKHPQVHIQGGRSSEGYVSKCYWRLWNPEASGWEEKGGKQSKAGVVFSCIPAMGQARKLEESPTTARSQPLCLLIREAAKGEAESSGAMLWESRGCWEPWGWPGTELVAKLPKSSLVLMDFLD